MQRIRRDIPILLNADRGPVAECNLAKVAAAGGSNAAALLLSTINPVRKLVVGDDVIELRGGLVIPGTPGLAAIHTDGRALIHGQRDNVGVLRIDPDGVIVVAAGRAFDGGKVLACVGRLVGRSVRNVNYIFVFRIDAHHRKVIAASPDPFFGIHQLPGLAGIVGAIDAAILLCVYHGIHTRGIAERDCQPDAAQFVGFARQALRNLPPVVAPIG